MEPLAIIGFAFKFPSGIESSDSFWDMMMSGDTGLSEVPEDRVNLQAFLDIAGGSAESDKAEKPKGYFMTGDVCAFDAPFFSITAEEAMGMDPQQRFLLETSYHALENAGLPLSKVNGSKTSVHVGCLSYDYRLAISRDAESATKYSATGTEVSILANRLSWYFNLKGPSISVETACSSSLVALDLASQLLRNGDTDMGIVAGTSLMLMPDLFIYLDNMGFLSPDSRCHSFDSRANGYARSEGLGVIIMKRLSDAIRDKNTIRAVIRSTATNSDGYTPGLTQPSEKSQLSLIRATYEKAGLSMLPTRFCEAHGTGTLLGDPIESNAIGSAFRTSRSTDDPLLIGAAKANIGHLEAASGIAGIIKSILVLERGVIPPIADLVELNPSIDHSYYNLKFPTKATPWPGKGLRRVSVNSFGFGGTNAHVVLDDARGFLAENGHQAYAYHNTVEESTLVGTKAINVSAAADTTENYTSRPYLAILSAADRNGIQRLGSLFSSYFKSASGRIGPETCRRLAFTLNHYRTSLLWKSYALLSSPLSLVNLGAELSAPKRLSSTKSPKLALVFTGQGSQWAKMGIELKCYPAFANSIRRSADILRSLGCLWDLETELHKDDSNSQINRPEFSQPISCALQIALVDLLERIGLHPSIVVGHSSGEVAAAYCKGALSHESAIRIAYYRGVGGSVASKDERKRTMMSVGLPETEAISVLKDLSGTYNDLHIACINSPGNVTVAGDEGHIDALKAALDKKGTFARKLKVSCAYHSPHMIPIAKKYFSLAGKLEERPGRSDSKSITMISYLDGKEISGESLRDLEYWITNMCSAVRFVDNVSGIDRLASLAGGRKRLDRSHKRAILITNILEIGPHSALKGPLREITNTFKFARDIQYDTALVRGVSGANSFLQAIGSLHCSGFEANISYLNGEVDGDASDRTIVPLVDLPSYPFAHTRTYWSESRRSKIERLRASRPNELLGNPTPDWQPLSASWRNIISRSRIEWLEDHNINDTVIYPGAGMLAMAIEGMNQYARVTLETLPSSFHLKHIEFLSAIHIPEAPADLELQLHLKPLQEGSVKLGWYEFEVFSLCSEQWKKSCKGLIRPEIDDEHESSDHKGNSRSAMSLPIILDNDSNYTSSVGSPTSPASQETETCPSTPGSEISHNWPKSNYAKPRGVGEARADEFFHDIRKAGYNYGPSFQRIERIQYPAVGEVQAIVEIYRQTGSSSHSGHGTRAIDGPHIIHPATLDAFFQLPLANIIKEYPNMPTMIPSKIKNLWISSEGLKNEFSPLVATAWHKFSGYRGSEHAISVTDGHNNLKLKIEGYEMSRVSGADISQEISPKDVQHCWNFEWVPFMIPESDVGTTPCHNSSRSGLVEVHVHNPSASTIKLADLLKAKLETGTDLQCIIIESGKAPVGSVVKPRLKIILWDIDRESILSDLDEEELAIVQTTLSTSDNVLWIQTSDQHSVAFPSQHLVDGLSRVVRQETSMTSFATLSLSTSRTTATNRSDAISRVSTALLSQLDGMNLPQSLRETITGDIEFCRLKKAAQLTEHVQLVRQSVPKPALWGESGSLKITIGSPGILDTIHFVEDAESAREMQDNEVEVEVKAAGVNFKDCLIALGALNEDKIGSEIAGIITRVGRSVKRLALGDRVCGFAADGYRKFYRTEEPNLSLIPSSLTFAEAASIPVNFATAWHALRYVARLQSGEKILIHSGAGGTGQAAIQIANHLGATIYTTVSTQEKRDFLTTHYKIPSERIFNSRDTKFADDIIRLAGGVDVVLNSLSGDTLFRSWECMAPFGRFVEIGKKDIQAYGKLPMAQFEKNISFSAVDLGHLHRERPKYVANLVDEALGLFGTGGTGLRPVRELRKFDVSNTVDAFRLIGTGKTIGKIVVEMNPESHVPVVFAPKRISTFSPNASYVIAGGLGGLGRVAARWMAERGAKHLILLSRSGPRTAEAHELMDELEKLGVNCVAPACDITDRQHLSTVLKSLNLPAIKGCIQSTMVLRSALFSDMSHTEWKEATACKTIGSWNLHELLPKDLDFFILLSSVQGVFGARTQANYNAANTYMDALALHRVSMGLKAVSLMLAVVTSDGYLAENEAERELLLAQNTYQGIQTPEFHALLDYYCDSSLPLLAMEDAQVTLGIQLLHKDPDLDPFGTSWGRNPMFQALRLLTSADSAKCSQQSSGKGDIGSQIAAAKTKEDAIQVIMGALTSRLSSAIVDMDPEEMDQSKPIQAYGVDSLQTMELRSWFLRYFRADLPTFSILGAPSVTALASTIVDRSAYRAH